MLLLAILALKYAEKAHTIQVLIYFNNPRDVGVFSKLKFIKTPTSLGYIVFKTMFLTYCQDFNKNFLIKVVKSISRGIQVGIKYGIFIIYVVTIHIYMGNCKLNTILLTHSQILPWSRIKVVSVHSYRLRVAISVQLVLVKPSFQIGFTFFGR